MGKMNWRPNRKTEAALRRSLVIYFMSSFLHITIADVDGIHVSTKERRTEPPSFHQLAEEESIVESLAPFLEDIWDPISRTITPKGIVVKLVDAKKVAVDLFCHCFDRDWPLNTVYICTIDNLDEKMTPGDISRMAAAFYKHFDRETPSRLERPLPKFHFNSQYLQNLLARNANLVDGEPDTLTLTEADLDKIDPASFQYLLRRSCIGSLILAGFWSEANLNRLLPLLQNLTIFHLTVEEKLPLKCIPLVEEIIWQNPRLVNLELDGFGNVDQYVTTSRRIPSSSPHDAMGVHHVPQLVPSRCFP